MMAFDTDFRLNIHFTVSSWINLSFGNYNHIITGDTSNVAEDNLAQWTFGIDPSGHLYTYLPKNGNVEDGFTGVYSTSAITSDVWNFIAFG